MIQTLQYLAATFSETPMIASREMRRLLDTDRKQFRDAAIALLKRKESPAGQQYALTLLVTNNLISERLADPSGFDLSEAIEVARRIQTTIDSFLDVKLVRSLVPSGNAPAAITEPDSILRVLEIVGAISDGSRVMTLLTQLFQHSNTRVRAKVSLLIGRINRNAQWVEKRMAEEDPRVRANAVESLWGMDTPEARDIFTSAITDPDNRVAGNGAVGLYRCNDLMGAEALVEMLEREEPKHRATAAWAMGHIADPRFLPCLSQRITEIEPSVRQNVFRSIANIRKRVKHCQDAGTVELSINRAETVGALRRIYFAALRGGTHQLPRVQTTDLVVVDGGRMVNRFTLTSRREPDHLAVGIVLPRGLTREDPMTLAVLNSIRVFLRYKRKLDGWAAAKYCTAPPAAQPVFRLESALLASGSGGGHAVVKAEDEGVYDQEPIRFTSDPKALVTYCETAGLKSTASENPAQALQRMLDALSIVRGYRSIFFYLLEPRDHDWREFAVRARESRTIIHVLATTAASTASLEALCADTGGSFFTVGSADEVGPACQRAAASLASLHMVEYEAPAGSNGPVKLQICSELGYGEDLHAVALRPEVLSLIHI